MDSAKFPLKNFLTEEMSKLEKFSGWLRLGPSMGGGDAVTLQTQIIQNICQTFLINEIYQSSNSLIILTCNLQSHCANINQSTSRSKSNFSYNKKKSIEVGMNTRDGVLILLLLLSMFAKCQILLGKLDCFIPLKKK